jgi:hypothetical protein
MKTLTKNLIRGLGAAICLLGVSIAYAGNTNILTVSASVTPSCNFSAGTSALSFGALDPTSSSNASATVDLSAWCTKGTTAAVTMTGTGGSNVSGVYDGTMVNGADNLPYHIALVGDVFVGAGKTATPSKVTVNGSILNTNYVNLPAVSYSDTVTFTITP